MGSIGWCRVHHVHLVTLDHKGDFKKEHYKSRDMEYMYNEYSQEWRKHLAWNAESKNINILGLCETRWTVSGKIIYKVINFSMQGENIGKEVW